MKSVNIDSLSSAAKELAAAGATNDDLAQLVAAAGGSFVVAMKVISDVTGLDLGDAKGAVLNSPAYRDSRASIDAFHESLERDFLASGGTVVTTDSERE